MAAWITGGAVLLAQAEAAPALKFQSKTGPVDYLIVLLFIGLTLFVVCKSSYRR